MNDEESLIQHALCLSNDYQRILTILPKPVRKTVFQPKQEAKDTTAAPFWVDKGPQYFHADTAPYADFQRHLGAYVAFEPGRSILFYEGALGIFIRLGILGQIALTDLHLAPQNPAIDETAHPQRKLAQTIQKYTQGWFVPAIDHHGCASRFRHPEEFQVSLGMLR